MKIHVRTYVIALVKLGLLVGLFTMQSVFAQAIKVEIIEDNGKYTLLRGGVPYQVRGAGMAGNDLERAAKYGANSVRTWSVDHNDIPALELLNRAHALGMTVSLCLEFARERHGFDYNDSAAVAKQLAQSRERVERLKDHPALLTWIIGNEVNFNFTNPKVFDAVNQVAEMIKEVDPNHPSTTALAGFDVKALDAISERAPALDFVSFQMYADIVNLPKYAKEYGYNEPYFVTEWGAVGHWEVFKTKWGAPVENTSSEKAANYAKSYLQVLQPHANQAIGNYVFLWGQKQEKTPTWYGMFLDSGEQTEPVDIMYYIWNGAKWPKNRSPRISPILLNGKSAFDNVFLFSGEQYEAAIKVVDPENDSYVVMWEVRKESTSTKEGGDAEYVPKLVEGVVLKSDKGKVTLQAPEEAGAYRLFAYAYDGQGKAAHANFPFYVK